MKLQAAPSPPASNLKQFLPNCFQGYTRLYLGGMSIPKTPFTCAAVGPRKRFGRIINCPFTA